MRSLDALRADRAASWLVVALGANLLLNALLIAALVWSGAPSREARDDTVVGFSNALFHPSAWTDSWNPMINAYQRAETDPGNRIYTVFFDEHIKFQYPPSALLVLDLLPSHLLRLENGEAGPLFNRAFGPPSQAAAVVTIVVSLLLFELTLRRRLLIPGSTSMSVIRVVCAGVLGYLFYPVIKAHELGQIQIYLDALVAIALLLQFLGRDKWAGACLGVCGLVKPHFALVMLWALLRRRWSFVLGMGTVAGAGIGLALVRFGWQNYLDYVLVLREISRLGEVFWPNQSVNGFLNRLLLNGNPIAWSGTEYAPFNSFVYGATLVTSALLVVMALWPFWRKAIPPDRATIDLAAILAAATMASPVAWEHHYGVFLPICAATIPLLLLYRPWGRASGPLALFAFLAMANVFLRPDLLFVDRWLGMLGSHLFFGGLTTFALVLAVRHRDARGGDVPQPAG